MCKETGDDVECIDGYAPIVVEVEKRSVQEQCKDELKDFGRSLLFDAVLFAAGAGARGAYKSAVNTAHAVGTAQSRLFAQAGQAGARGSRNEALTLVDEALALEAEWSGAVGSVVTFGTAAAGVTLYEIARTAGDIRNWIPFASSAERLGSTAAICTLR